MCGKDEKQWHARLIREHIHHYSVHQIPQLKSVVIYTLDAGLPAVVCTTTWKRLVKTISYSQPWKTYGYLLIAS